MPALRLASHAEALIEEPLPCPWSSYRWKEATKSIYHTREGERA
jgi:hypothetical protein